MNFLKFGVFAFSFTFAGIAAAQSGVLSPLAPTNQNARVLPPAAGQAGDHADPSLDSLRENYTLGPNDQVMIRAFEAEELNDRSFRVDSGGYLNLPMVGRVKVTGMTVQQLEQELSQLLKQFIKEPQISVTVLQFRTSPVFLSGSFKNPGIYPLQGQRSLIEMLTVAGGLLPNASRRIRVTRRAAYGKIPLPNAIEDSSRGVSIVDIQMNSLQEGSNAAEDLTVQPYDVISSERAELIYVSGAINRVGAIELAERDSLSVTQVIAMSGGIRQDGDQHKVMVLRPILDTARRAEIEVDLREIYAGKANDLPLMPNDYVVVPVNKNRTFATKTLPFILAPLPYLLFSRIP